VRTFTIAVSVAAALAACGGRSLVQASDEGSGGCAPDCIEGPSNAGSAARGGAGGRGSAASHDANSEAAGAADFLAGAGGEPADASAPSENEAGSGAWAGAGNGTGAGNLAGCGNVAGGGFGGSCASSASPFATDALSHSFGGGQDFNQASGFPQAILGPPAANDPSSVVSLGNGGWVVLSFGGNAIVDGPGVDFTVFENPLPTFKELASVAVSDDGEHWTEFPCTAAQDTTDFGLCAGVGVVFSSTENGIDPLDPAVSGGDHYDLADIGVRHARYVRITDRVDLTGAAGVFDLDAVAIIHGECR